MCIARRDSDSRCTLSCAQRGFFRDGAALNPGPRAPDQARKYTHRTAVLVCAVREPSILLVVAELEEDVLADWTAQCSQEQSAQRVVRCADCSGGGLRGWVVD